MSLINLEEKQDNSSGEQNISEAPASNHQWHDTKRYKTIEEQAQNEPIVRAHSDKQANIIKDLEKQIAEYTAIPEEYKIENEDYTKVPECQALLKVAKQSKLNNKVVNELVKSIYEDRTNFMAEQIKQIGGVEIFKEQQQFVSQWIKSNFGESAELIANLASDANGFKALQLIRQKFIDNSPITNPNIPNQILDEQKTDEELYREFKDGTFDERYMRFKNGSLNPKYNKEFQEKIDKKYTIYSSRNKK